MEQYKPTALKHRLFSTLITIGFIFLGGIVGVFVGALLYTYLIPFWNSTEIDVEGRNFTEIVLVESGFLENVHLSQDNVILKADDGNYYAYHQNKWQLTSLPEFDKPSLHTTLPLVVNGLAHHLRFTYIEQEVMSASSLHIPWVILRDATYF